MCFLQHRLLKIVGICAAFTCDQGASQLYYGHFMSSMAMGGNRPSAWISRTLIPRKSSLLTDWLSHAKLQTSAHQGIQNRPSQFLDILEKKHVAKSSDPKRQSGYSRCLSFSSLSSASFISSTVTITRGFFLSGFGNSCISRFTHFLPSLAKTPHVTKASRMAF